MRPLLPLAGLGLLLSSIGHAGLARDLHQRINQSCSTDIQKFCKDVSKTGGHIMACLRAHDDKLSVSCTKEWNQAKARWESTMKGQNAACSKDVQKFCMNTVGLKSELSCLSEHHQELSSSCKSFRERNHLSG